MTDHVYFFNTGVHRDAYKFLGSKKTVVNDQTGYLFSVWAPNAYNVLLTGDFNHWDRTQMERLEGGVWSVFVANATPGQCYKYGIDHGNGYIEYKMDPFGYRFEIAPKDATIIEDLPDFNWTDGQWMSRRERVNKFEQQ